MEHIESRRLERFEVLCNEIDGVYHNIAVKLGLSDSAYEILSVIWNIGEGCCQTDICRYICMNKQTVNSSVKQLVKKGVIYFRAGKGRESGIFFTEAGRAFAEKKIGPIAEAENDIMEALTPEEYEELMRLSQKYLDILRGKMEDVLGTGEAPV